MVFLVVNFLSKSDNVLAKFLNFLKGPSIDYLILLFFELTHMYVKQKPSRLFRSLTLELGPTVGGTVLSKNIVLALFVKLSNEIKFSLYA